MIIGGLDLGTSGCKLSIYDGDRLLTQARASYPASRSGGTHSIDADLVWSKVKAVFAQAVAENSRCRDMAAVAVSSFGEAAVPLDASGRVLGESLLFSDNNGREELARLVAKVGEGKIREIAGVPPHPMYTLCKMAWLKRHADYFPRVKNFLLFEDFIIHRLSGERAISYSLAGRTMGLDVAKRGWSGELFEAAGLDPALMSRPVASGTRVGRILPEIAAELGVSRDLSVITGGHDQMCAAVGAGAIRKGIGGNGSGTVEALSVAVPPQCHPAALSAANYSYAIHADPAVPFTYAFCGSGSIVLSWYVKTFGLGEVGSFTGEVAAAALPRPTDLLALPYFTGTGTPHLDTDAKGHLAGMTLETTREEIFVALLEGLSFDLAVNVERLRGLGIILDSLRTSGGGSFSPLWLQIKADVVGMPVHTLRNPEASALGCILLAATAMGQFPDIYHAVDACVATAETYYPDPERQQRYRARMGEFEALYQAGRNAAMGRNA